MSCDIIFSFLFSVPHLCKFACHGGGQATKTVVFSSSSISRTWKHCYIYGHAEGGEGGEESVIREILL